MPIASDPFPVPSQVPVLEFGLQSVHINITPVAGDNAFRPAKFTVCSFKLPVRRLGTRINILLNTPSQDAEKDGNSTKAGKLVS